MRIILLIPALCVILLNFEALGQPKLDPSEYCIKGNGRIVPNILGLDVVNAQNLIENCDLEWSFLEHPKTLSYEIPGQIGAQKPNGGLLVAKGTIVRGFKSKGLYIPRVIDWNGVEAKSFLEDLRFKVEVVEDFDSADNGDVFEQHPGNGALFPFGQLITLSVSLGPGVVVPKVEGMKLSVAVALLHGKSLISNHDSDDEFGESKEPDSDICKVIIYWREVVTQDPEKGVEVAKYSVITLTSTRKWEMKSYDNCPLPK